MLAFWLGICRTLSWLLRRRPSWLNPSRRCALMRRFRGRQLCGLASIPDYLFREPFSAPVVHSSEDLGDSICCATGPAYGPARQQRAILRLAVWNTERRSRPRYRGPAKEFQVIDLTVNLFFKGRPNANLGVALRVAVAYVSRFGGERLASHFHPILRPDNSGNSDETP
jgi:hypothetical protein